MCLSVQFRRSFTRERGAANEIQSIGGRHSAYFFTLRLVDQHPEEISDSQELRLIATSPAVADITDSVW